MKLDTIADMLPKAGGRLVIGVSSAVALYAVAGSLGAAFTTALAALWLFLPAWWIVSSLMAKGGAESTFARIFAAVSVMVLAAPAYILRKHAGQWQGLFDLGLGASLWALLLLCGGWRRWIPEVKAMIPLQSLPWVGVFLPTLGALAWAGFEVHQGGSVRYYGIHLVDSGNLVAITNLVRCSPGLPLSTFGDPRPLSYHWLFFAVPAWLGEFGVMGIPTARALLVVNVGAGILLYLSVLLATERLLTEKDLSSRFLPHLVGAALLCGSSLYAYQLALRGLHAVGGTGGDRNHLLLQMPLSLSTFGNNTLALAMVLLTLEALALWKESGRVRYLIGASALTPLIAGYSVTLLFTVSIAVAIGAVRGVWRRPLLTLMVFALVGSLGLGVLDAIGLFSNTQAEGMQIAFDGGRFVRNVLLGFAPATIGLIWFIRTGGARFNEPHLLLCAVGLAVPTFLMTRGTSTANVDMSMKTGSLYLAAAAPLLAVAMLWAIGRWREHRVAALSIAAAVAVGAGNTAAFAVQFLLYRAGIASGSHQDVRADHFDALRFLSQEAPRGAVLLDELSIEYSVANPALMIGERRVLIGSTHERTSRMMSSVDRDRLSGWEAWRVAGFRDESLSRQFSGEADYLLTESPVGGAYWVGAGEFGKVKVYRSRNR